MDRQQLEQRIRDRAYELWMRDGGVSDRAEDYWYQAEREILQEAGSLPAEEAGSGGGEAEATLTSPDDATSSPVGVATETPEDVLPNPIAKTRKKRSAASTAPAEDSSTTGEKPKRKRAVRIT